uniref:Calcineurin-like phosphoesterase domain-containing protein n=2 Tax=Guillardia theta TaxID=55529 RepID=A0A7S4MZZ5_GUITH|mmetsp:Transcript_14379/g.49113  ORF Transcript_14379/g.49113 Transcript_14379/m.49113 type:complete len:453 (+) Transcript_14379:197-1555(+)
MLQTVAIKSTSLNFFLCVLGGWIALILYLEVLSFLLLSWSCERQLQYTQSLHEGGRGATESSIKLLLLGDTHVLGPSRRHQLDIRWSDWGLRKAFATAVWMHSPKVVVFDGDLFDEGNIASNREFRDATRRLQRIFGLHPPPPSSSPEGQQQQDTVVFPISPLHGEAMGKRYSVLVTPGNHDIGLGATVSEQKMSRFEQSFGLLNGLVCLQGHAFILFNTQVLATSSIYKFRKQLMDSLTSEQLQAQVRACGDGSLVLLQHMPFYRLNDQGCGSGRDACLLNSHNVYMSGESPQYCKETKGGVTFKARDESLIEGEEEVINQVASEELLASLRPDFVIAAHLHAPCRRQLLLPPHNQSLTDETAEITLPTMAWRMRPDAGYAIAILRGKRRKGEEPQLLVAFCALPNEHNILRIYAAGVMLTLIAVLAFVVRDCFKAKATCTETEDYLEKIE